MSFITNQKELAERTGYTTEHIGRVFFSRTRGYSKRFISAVSQATKIDDFLLMTGKPKQIKRALEQFYKSEIERRDREN